MQNGQTAPSFPVLNLADLHALEASNSLSGFALVGHEDYHAGPGISSTFIKDILRSPAHAKQAQKDRKTTPAMEFGTALHMAILEPHLFDKTAVVRPEFSGKGSVAARAAWDEENACKTILTPDDMRNIDGMRNAAARSRTMDWLLADAVHEVAGYWTDPKTGLLLKVKPDIWRGGDVIGDIKTTDDARPEHFIRSIVKYGYHISGAHYVDGISHISGDSQTMVLIAMEKKAPYGITFHALSPDTIMTGFELREQALRVWKKWFAEGDFQAVYPDTILEPRLPNWYLRGLEDE